MKMKKVLAGITAASLVVSSLSIALWADSADEKVLSSAETVFGAWEETSFRIGDAISAEDLDTYDDFAITVSVDTLPDDGKSWQAQQIVKIYGKADGEGYEWNENDELNNSVNGSGVAKGVTNIEIGESYTVKISIADVMDDLQAKLHEGDDVKTTISAFNVQNAYQATGAKITISKISLVKASEEEQASLVTIPFEDKEYEITVIHPEWDKEHPDSKTATIDTVISIDGVELGTTTISEIKNKTLKLTGIEFRNCDDESITADNVTICMFIQEPTYTDWIASSYATLSTPMLEWDLSTIPANKDNLVIQRIGYQLSLNNDLTDIALGTKYIINKAEPEEIPAIDISLAPTKLSLYVGDTETLEATVDPENTTDEISWESDNEEAATVEASADGKTCKVKAIGKGSATITAKTSDDVFATCKVEVKIAATALVLTDIDVKVGEKADIDCSVTPTGAEVPEITYETSDPTIFKVVGNKVEGVNTGTATLTATATVKGNTLTKTCKVNVSNPATAIALTDMSVLVGAEKDIVPTLTPTNADKPEITYKSSDTSIFTVAEGKIKGIAAGTAELSAEATVNGTKLPTAKCKVTVTAEAKPATAVALDKTTLELVVDGSGKLTATLTPTDTTDNITWSSSKEEVATVDNGEVKALAVGEAIITAKANDTVSATCKVTVTAKTIAITSVTLNKTAATVEEGETVQLEATVNPETTTEDKTVSWSTSDETVATVDNTGKVTAVKAGEAVITAKAGTKTADCTITVTAKVSEGEGTVDPDDGLIIEVDDEDITIEADSDTFEETVTVVKAEVSVSEDVAEEKTDAIADAVKDILDGEESTVEVGAVISITLKDQDGNEIQPVSGGVVTITVPYDGKSNYAAYIDGTAAEFIKLVINEAKTYASFDAKHFSDYYLVALSDEAADAIDKENGENEDPKPDDPKPDDPKPDDPKPGDDDKNKVEKTYEGSMVVNETKGWSEFEVAKADLIGEFAPEDVKSVEFTCADHDFQIGYNNTAGTWSQITVKKGEKALQTDILLTDYYALKIGFAAGDGVDYTISWVTTALVEDDGSGDDNKDDKDNINIAFEDKAYELEVVDATGWSGGEYTKAAQVNAEVNIDGITYGTTTFGDIKNKTVTLSDIVYKNCEIEGIKASDIEIYIYMLHGETGSETWVGSEAGSMADKTVTWDLSTLAEAKAAIPDSSPIQAIGYQINIKGSVVKAIEDMEIGAKVKVNEAGGSGDDDNKTETVIWEGTYNAGTDWDWDSRLIIEAAKFANASAGDTIKIDFTINGEATYHQIQIKDGANDGILTSPEGVNEWAAIDVSTEGFSFVLNDADTATLKAKGMQLMGYDVTYKSVTLVTSGSGTPSQPSTPSEPSTPSAPSGNNYTIPTTSGSPSGETTTETTSAPAAASAPAESEQAAPSATEEDTSTNTTSPYATADSGDDVQPTEAGAAIPDDGNDGNVGNAGAGNAEDKNVATGVALALIPAIAAAAAVVISKKRK